MVARTQSVSPATFRPLRTNKEGNMNRGATRWRTITILIGVVVLLMVPFTASAKNPNPGVLPPNASPNGSTYGEWSARWWQWALGQPADVNPVLDTDGKFCNQGQAGPVWFLAGTFCGDAERNCTVPTGKMLFFPIYSCPYIGFPTDLNDTPKKALKEAAKCVTEWLQQGSLTAEVDGTSIGDLGSYRKKSPIFEVKLPVDNVAGITADQCPATKRGDLLCRPNAADGVYLMLAPLSRGEHVIHFSATGFLDVTYRITVRGK
jgi:hypothetical protein